METLLSQCNVNTLFSLNQIHCDFQAELTVFFLVFCDKMVLEIILKYGARMPRTSETTDRYLTN